MASINTIGKIAFLTTYPPRESGIASFTQDLINAIDSFDIVETSVIAVNNSIDYEYDSKVIAELNEQEQDDYIKMAQTLNESEIELLVIEHDYEIYGGTYGEYILDLVRNLEIPIVTTLHIVLSEPNAKQKSIVCELAARSEKIVTMAANTKVILSEVYGIEEEKIDFIHHGVTKKLIQSRDALKKKYKCEHKQIISTFGLLSPGKGIEDGIEAVAKVARENKHILYLILGEDNPALKEKGPIYRKQLMDLVEKLQLKGQVKFVNKHLSKDEIIQYLQLSDIYMTPYLGKDQAVSGTLAYAVAYGRAIVSTPYLYAEEMLSDGRGMLAEFNNSDSLVECIQYILKNPLKKSKMERDIIRIGRTMYWDKIAKGYMDVFTKILKDRAQIEII